MKKELTEIIENPNYLKGEIDNSNIHNENYLFSNIFSIKRISKNSYLYKIIIDKNDYLEDLDLNELEIYTRLDNNIGIIYQENNETYKKNDFDTSFKLIELKEIEDDKLECVILCNSLITEFEEFENDNSKIYWNNTLIYSNNIILHPNKIFISNVENDGIGKKRITVNWEYNELNKEYALCYRKINEKTNYKWNYIYNILNNKYTINNLNENESYTICVMSIINKNKFSFFSSEIKINL